MGLYVCTKSKTPAFGLGGLSNKKPLIAMNDKLLLVTAITLLFRESQLPGNGENSASLVREIIGTIKVPELNIGLDHERDILEGLRSTALAMCDDPVGQEYDANALMQRLKANCDQDEILYQTFLEGMLQEMSDMGLKRNCLNLKRSLTNHIKEIKISDAVQEAYYELKFKRSKIPDMKKFVSEVVSKLEPYQVETGEKDPAIISEIDTSDISAVEQVYVDAKASESGEGVLVTGFQGLNRMIGGGFRRGEEWVIGALQHNFKTGFSLTVFEHLAMFNVPVLTNPLKKPLLLRISFEDPVTLNFQYLYQNMVENETGVMPDITGIPEAEIAKYVTQRLHRNGYHTRFLHVNPSMWTYRDIQNKILELEADGYEIHVCMLDYLMKVPTTGCDQGPMGHDLRNMYERLAAFMKHHNICLITPHQLNPKAKELIRVGTDEFVKQLVGKGYYSNSSQIDQVVDGEIFIHIEEVNNGYWLTIQGGKLRRIKQVKKEHKYMAIPFHPAGLHWDFDKADSTRKKVGGGPIGSKDETPFWSEDPSLHL